MKKIKKKSSRPRIGLALGSGSARGWAHIGVIRGLEKLGIEPDVVCGSSVGALVGAAYASGHLNLLEEWLKNLKWGDILRYMVRSFMGKESIQSQKELSAIFGNKIETVLIEDLSKDFGAVATDLDTGQEIWLRKGPLLSSISPTIAIPGLLNPIYYEGRWLMDGGLVNPVPVSLCRALGADIVIAVNLNGDLLGKNRFQPVVPDPPQDPAKAAEEMDLWERLTGTFRNNRKKKTKPLDPEEKLNQYAPKMFEVITGAINIMQDRITRSRMAGDPPDISLSPHLSHIGLLEFHRSEDAILEGKACVERMSPVLEDLIRRTR
ncbi:MAG: patatin-like phospholipase family protein [Leptospirales bacterium]